MILAVTGIGSTMLLFVFLVKNQKSTIINIATNAFWCGLLCCNSLQALARSITEYLYLRSVICNTQHAQTTETAGMPRITTTHLTVRVTRALSFS